MKRLALIIASLFVISARAEITDQLWTSLAFGLDTPLSGSASSGDGSDWWVEVWNVTDSNNPTMSLSNTAVSLGWFDGVGYGFNEFDFTATETDQIVLRLYDASTVLGANYFIESSAFILPDLEAPFGGNDFDVQFDFSSSSWQAVPEPSTFMLLMAGGAGAWVMRRARRFRREDLA